MFLVFFFRIRVKIRINQIQLLKLKNKIKIARTTRRQIHITSITNLKETSAYNRPYMCVTIYIQNHIYGKRKEKKIEEKQ